MHNNRINVPVLRQTVSVAVRYNADEDNNHIPEK
jgi:hypothetical protein